MRKILILLLTVCTLFMLLGLLPVHSEAELYENVIRLHVIANSDSDDDQALKLKVRDAILENAGELFASCQTKEEAQNAVTANIALITETAMAAVRENGYEYSVSVTLGEERYPTRSYGEICFPSGNYLSLRVIIGEGTGQNWWCVLFPPMCMSAAVEADDSTAIPTGLTKEQYNLITETNEPKYNVRFKILEAFSK